MGVTRTTPISRDSRPPCSEHNLKDASHVDFKCLDANVGGKASNAQWAQWLVDVQKKAHGVYMQAAHSQTQRAKSRVGGRLPIDCDDSDHDTSETTESEEVVKVSTLLDRVAACMAAASAPDGERGDESRGADSADSDWSQPGQLEAFLNKCLESWEAHNDMLVALSQMQQRLQEAYEQNELLRWYSGHLKERHDGGSSTTTDIIQEAKEAKKAAASAAASSQAAEATGPAPASSVCV